MAVILACAPFFLGGCGEGEVASSASSAAAREACARGVELLRERSFAAAEEVLIESLAHDDGDAFAHYHLGVARYEQSVVTLGALNVDHAKLELAVKSLERAIELDGGQASFHVYLGLALERGRAMGAARAAYGEALRLDPANLRARVHLGMVLAYEGEQAAAEREFEAAIVRSPRAASAHHQLGLLCLETSNWGRARDAFGAATRIDASEPDPWFGLSTALRRLGDDEGAERALAEFRRVGAEARNKRPAGRRDGALAHFQRGIELYRAGKDDEAKQAFEAVLAIQPQSGAAHANLGFVLMRQGESTQARQHLLEALRIQPGNQKARELLSKLDGVAGD